MKIIIVNKETQRLIEIARRDLKEACEKNEMLDIMEDVINSDNLIIQSALRSATELNFYMVEQK